MVDVVNTPLKLQGVGGPWFELKRRKQESSLFSLVRPRVTRSKTMLRKPERVDGVVAPLVELFSDWVQV